MAVNKIIKPYDKVVYNDGKGLLHSELNESQDILKTESIRTRNFCSGDGPSGDSFRVYVKDSTALKITSGYFIHRGQTLYLESDVVLPYEISLISQGELYEVVCTWTDTVVDYTYDSTLLNTSTGPTADRATKELLFSLERKDTAYSYDQNRIVLADVYFDGSIATPAPLETHNITDVRYNFAQHYVSHGFSFDSAIVENGVLNLVLSNGSVFYMGKYYKAEDPTLRTWSIPLPQGESRILLYLKEEKTLEGTTISPRFAEMTLGSTLTGTNLKLFEVTLSSLGLVEGSMNDIRVYEPITRSVIPDRETQAKSADFYALKPTETLPPTLRVEVNSGWYYFKGEYKYFEKTSNSHPVPTTGMLRRDVAIINEENELLIYKSPEVADTEIPEDTSPQGYLKIYDVVLDSTITGITYPEDPTSVQAGELRDLRPIIKARDFASNISVDSSSFSTKCAGGLTRGGDGNLQDYLVEIDAALVGLTSSVQNLSITPEDSPEDSVAFGADGSLELGHDPYIGDNTNSLTKVGIKVVTDPLTSGKVTIQNTWDEELRLLASPVVLDSTYHTHADMDIKEDGAEIRFSSSILDYNSDKDYVRFSDLVMEDSLFSKFIKIPSSQGMPSHIGLKTAPFGGLIHTEDGYRVDPTVLSVSYDASKSIVDEEGNGYGVYISETLSGLTFVQDVDNLERNFLGVKLGSGLSLDAEGKIILDLNADSALVSVGNTLSVATENPLYTTEDSKLSIRIEDSSGDVDKASFLELVTDSVDTTKSFLSLKVASNKGLGVYSSAGEAKLAVLVKDPISYSPVNGAISLSIDTNSFSITDKKLALKKSSLGDDLSIKKNAGDKLYVNVDPNGGLEIGPNGLRLK